MERFIELGQEMALLWSNYKGSFFLGSGHHTESTLLETAVRQLNLDELRPFDLSARLI